MGYVFIYYYGLERQLLSPNFDGVFDWDFLLPAFAGTKIQPTDIDAAIERNGRVLIFETKEPGKPIPRGQELLLMTLLSIGRGKINVMVLFGKTELTVCGMEEWYFLNGGIRKRKATGCDCTHVFNRVSAWWKYANQDNNGNS